MEPDEWGAKNRVYPATAGYPGRRDPTLTPYGIAFGRSVASRTHKRVALVMFSQGGKSETLLDIIGHRLDTSPVPILYLGPTKQFITEQWEPRIGELLEQAPALAKKASSVQTKTKKVIAGVPLRLAHGGSSAALKSDAIGLALTDEVEELMLNVKGAGNPVRLVDERGKTYADFVHALTSTPGEGTVDVERDPVSGLEFWAEADAVQISSMIWRIWQSGTRHHFALPCPHCGEFLIPRSKMLMWDKPKLPNGKEGKAAPALARQTAHVDCPSCGCEIDDSHREAMISAGIYVAPGQSIKDGAVIGHPVDAETISYWVSGLCNPFETWGDMAAKIVDAENSGDPEEIKVVVNGTFGELYSPGGGKVPEWQEVAKKRDYRDEGDFPPDCLAHVLTVDVQADRLYYVRRAWGARATSWLIEHGVLWGETNKPFVWDLLQDVLDDDYDGMRIRRAFIDSGFNPNGKDFLPTNRVYEFCAKNRRVCFPTKGYATLTKPLIKQKPEVDKGGNVAKYGLELIRLDTDYWKSWVHERIRWPKDSAGDWHLNKDTDDDYCKQIVAEARVLKPGGRPEWVARARDNHYLDCEAMNAAVGYMLNMHKIRAVSERRRSKKTDDTDRSPRDGNEPKSAPKKAKRKKNWAMLG